MALQARIGLIHCLHRQLSPLSILCEKPGCCIETNLLVEHVIRVYYTKRSGLFTANYSLFSLFEVVNSSIFLTDFWLVINIAKALSGVIYAIQLTIKI